MNDASHRIDGATFNDRSEDARGCFTILQSLQPPRVGKRYSVDANGKLIKEKPVVSIWRGRATTVAATVANFVKALRKTTESSDTVLVLDSFRGAAPGAPAVIEVVTDEELGRLTDGADAASPNQGYFETEDAFWSARLKDRMEPSRYLLFDADNAPGMPEKSGGSSLWPSGSRCSTGRSFLAWIVEMPADRIPWLPARRGWSRRRTSRRPRRRIC